jgi:hypothetical protein
MASRNDRLGLAHYLLFSFNIAYAVMLAIAARLVFIPLVRLRTAVNRLLGLDAMEAPGAYLAFFLSAVFLAMLLFLSATGLRRISILERILVPVSGFAALGVAPACWYYIEHASRGEVVEGLIALAFGALFIVRRLRLPVVLSALLVSVHYGFWIWRFWYATEDSLGLLVPVLGLFSGILWVAYVNRAVER